jgi:VIT1/CCC1 family predicted Fe2+/Mn2+ transporter
VAVHQDPPIKPEETPVDLRFQVGFLTLDPHRIIYGTIILTTAYAIYDEGTEPLGAGPYFDMVALSFAPLFALAMAHVFSDALDLQIRHQRRLTGQDRRHLLVVNAQFLYVALPPLALMGALALLDWDANDAVAVAQVLGLASLFWWGYYAGRKAGVKPFRRWTFGLSYALLGLLVILVELLLTH